MNMYKSGLRDASLLRFGDVVSCVCVCCECDLKKDRHILRKHRNLRCLRALDETSEDI